MAAGLRYILLDEAAYGDEKASAKAPFSAHVDQERHFDDGTGVTVWVLKP